MRQFFTQPLSSALLASALLLSSNVSQAKDETTPLTVDASFNAEAASEKGFTIADNKVLKGVKRVADPARYQDVVGAGLASATSMVVARMKTER